MKNGSVIRIEVKTGEVDELGRAKVLLERNVGKFDVLALVNHEGQIRYQMHMLLESSRRPRIVDAETEQGLRDL